MYAGGNINVFRNDYMFDSSATKESLVTYIMSNRDKIPKQILDEIIDFKATQRKSKIDEILND